MASVSKDESSEDDLYGDIDDMYVSQSETELVNKPEDDAISTEDTLISDLYDSSKPEETSQEEPCTEDGNDMDDLDLYDDLIAEEEHQKVNSFQEMMKKFEEAMKVVQQLESENKVLRESLNKQETSNKVIQKNFSSLLITAKGEINRKDNELNTLRKRLTNKQRTPAKFRNQREQTTEASSFTSIDSDFDPLCVSSPGRQKWQRYGDKSPNKYRKDNEKHRSDRGGNDSTDRSRQELDERSVEKHDRRRSKSKDKEKSSRTKIRTNDSDRDERRRKHYEGDNERNSDKTKKSHRNSDYESDINIQDDRHRKVEGESKSKNLEKVERESKSKHLEKDSVSEKKSREDRPRIASDNKSRSDKERSDRRAIVDKDKRCTSVESKLNEKNDYCNDRVEKSGIIHSGNKPKIDLREKLRLKRLAEAKQKTDIEETSTKTQSSRNSLSTSSVKKKIVLVQMTDSNDSCTETAGKTRSNSNSKAVESEPEKRPAKKIKENLNAEKEFLEQLKVSIKKNELTSKKVTNYTYLEKTKTNKKEVGQKTSSREVVSYSDASNEVSDVENITDNVKTTLDENYFTATPDFSESNETSYEDAYGALSDVDNENTDKNNTCVMVEETMKFNDETKSMEKMQGSSDRNNPESSIQDILNKDNHSASIDTVKCAGNEKTEYEEINSKCDNTQNNDFEPMEIQSTTNSNDNTSNQIPLKKSQNEGKVDLNQTNSNIDKVDDPKSNSLNVSPNVSNSSRNEETPGSARRRSARLQSKSESSINSCKTSPNTDNVCSAESVADKKSENCVESNAKLSSAEKNKSRNLQRLDSRSGKRKRVRRCVISETISCITSVLDSDTLTSVSDEAGDLSMSTDDTENSEETFTSESPSGSGKLQNLVCTDINCSIKMRHLHPKCVGDKTKSPEFLKESYTNKDNELSQSLNGRVNDKVEDNADKMEVDEVVNTLECLNATERLNSVDLDSKLENIHTPEIENKVSGTVEITAEESVDDSESSSSSSSGSSSSSSDTGSSTGSSDSESESDFSNIEDENTQVKHDTETIESSELVIPTVNNNSNLINDQDNITHMDVNDIDKMSKQLATETEINVDHNEGTKECKELKTTDSNTDQLLTSTGNAPENKLETYMSMEENCGSLVNSSDISPESNQKKTVNGITSEKILQTVDKSKRKSIELIAADLKSSKSVTEAVTKKDEETNKINSDHIEQTLKEKTVNDTTSSINVDAMESNLTNDDQTCVPTEISGLQKMTELQHLEERENGKETKSNTTEAFENESDGSFGSNIMSEKTDSLHSGDESEFSDTDDSGSSYSGDNTSSSDESGTGSSWETYSSNSEPDSDSEEDIDNVKALPKNNTSKPLIQISTDIQNDELQNKEVNPVQENLVEMEEENKAIDSCSPMETDDIRDNEMIADVEVNKDIDLNKEMSNDVEMGADYEREMSIEPCPSIAEKPYTAELLKLPEIEQTPKNTAGISPDRSHMLQCLLNCVQNEVLSNKSLIEKFNHEENVIAFDTSENSKGEKDICSASSTNNVQMESLNQKIESCQPKSPCTENFNVSEVKDASTTNLVKVIDIAHSLEGRERGVESREKIMPNDQGDVNIFDDDFSASDYDSSTDDSDESSAYTHPTDCSTCTSSSGSSPGSETESDEELGHEGKCGKEVTSSNIDGNFKLITTAITTKSEDLKCQKRAEDSHASENIVTEKKKAVTDTVIDKQVNEIVTDFSGKLEKPCNNNPYWIADELPEFLKPTNSQEVCKDKCNYDKTIPKTLHGAESSRLAPTVKFANLSPKGKVQNINVIPEVQIKTKKNVISVGVLPSVIQGEKELVNDKIDKNKNVKANVSHKKGSKHSEVKSNSKNEPESSMSESNLNTGKSGTSGNMTKTRNNSKSTYKTGKPKQGKPDNEKKSMCDTKSSESLNTRRQKSVKPVTKSVEKNHGSKKRETQEELDIKNDKKQNVTSRRQQIGDKNSTKKGIVKQDKANENQPLRRSPRKKPSQISVIDTKHSEASTTGRRKHGSGKASEETNLKKEKLNSKMNSKISDHTTSISVKTKKMKAGKLIDITEKGDKNKSDEASLHSRSSSSKTSEKVDMDSDIKEADKKDKKHGNNDSLKVNEKSENSLFQEGMKPTGHKISVDSKDKNRKISGSQHLAIPEECNLVKSHFRDTTRELSEKIMKLKVEQNMLKNELAEKKRKESDSLKMKLTIPKPHDSKLRKETKENIKGKAPVQGMSKSGKTQPLKVAMGTNGHDEMKSKTCTSKKEIMNKNENLTFGEKLGECEEYISKSTSHGRLTNRNTADSSMSLSVQCASLKTFTIPKLLDVRKNDIGRKKEITNSKSESSVSQNRSTLSSSRSGNSRIENRTRSHTSNKSSSLKSDDFKKSELQTKSNKIFITTESESSISDSDSETESDSSNDEASDSIVKAIFGSSDSSGNSKKSITLADLCKTRSSEDTDDIVKENTQELNENDVLDKRKDVNLITCNEKDSAKDKTKCIVSSNKKTSKTVNKKLVVNKPSVDNDKKESKQVLEKSSGDRDKRPSGSGSVVEKGKTSITGKVDCKRKATEEKSTHHKGSKKVFSKTKDCDHGATKEKDTDKVNIKVDNAHKDIVRKKSTSHKPDKEKEKRKEQFHSSLSEHTLRKSPRIKARSPDKVPSNFCDDSRDEAGFKGLRRSNRTPSKSENSNSYGKNEVRYFELSEKNPILNKIISPKKPKLDLDVDDSKVNSKESKISRKHEEKEGEKETKGVPILLLEENTMDGIDYHDDVTLDTDIGNQFSEDNVNNENNSDNASSKNSDTDLSVEEGELSDSEGDNEKEVKGALDCLEEPLKKFMEVTPKKQKIPLNKGTRGRGRISPVRYSQDSTSSHDRESACKCSKKDCIHSRLSLNDLAHRKRYKSDSDSASDNTALRRKHRFRPDHPSVRNRSRDKEDRLHTVKSREKCNRKSPIHSRRRSPLRRRSRSRSTSPRREGRRMPRSNSPRKSRSCRKDKEGPVSRYRNDSGSGRRHRRGSREHSESPDRYSRRKNQSFDESYSENTIDAQERGSKMKRHHLERLDEELSSENCRDSERNDETSDEESRRFSKHKFEKTRDSVKGIESHSERKGIRSNERRNFRENSDYIKSRRRSRSKSRSPHNNRRRKRLRSDSDSDVSERGEGKDKRGASDKYKDRDSPSHKRSKSGKSGIDSPNEYSERSRKR